MKVKDDNPGVRNRSVAMSYALDSDPNNTAYTTFTGHKFDVFDPETWVFDVKDIARSLSNISRYAGHTATPVPVAEHCIAVCVKLREWGCAPDVQEVGLFHDAVEAYMGDVPSPYKRYVRIGDQTYLELESQMELALFTQFGLWDAYTQHWDVVKKADYEVYLEERDRRPNVSVAPWRDWYEWFMHWYLLLERERLVPVNEVG